MDASDLDGDYERRGRGAAGGFVGESKLFAVVWNDHSQEKHRQDIEEQDSVERLSDSGRHSLSGIISLTKSRSMCQLGARHQRITQCTYPAAIPTNSVPW